MHPSASRRTYCSCLSYVADRTAILRYICQLCLYACAGGQGCAAHSSEAAIGVDPCQIQVGKTMVGKGLPMLYTCREYLRPLCRNAYERFASDNHPA